MIDNFRFTTEQFLSLLEEGERWIELEAGRLIRHTPPDDAHGNVVRNVARALASHIRERPEVVACFDLGLVLETRENTVRCPAISCFPLPSGFEESDKLITTSRPRLIMEVASTNDRRRLISDRVKSYLEWGVAAIWVFDPVDQQVHVFRLGMESKTFRQHETLQESTALPGFRLSVAEAFADPRWDSPS